MAGSVGGFIMWFPFKLSMLRILFLIFPETIIVFL